MKNIKVVSTGYYLPKIKILNEEISNKLELEDDYIFKRTGIKQRYYINEDEDIISMAINATNNAIEKLKINKQEIEMIIVATTTTDNLMPGISYMIQKQLDIENTICLDVLAGCSGYINALDIARTYIAIDKIKTAVVIGVDCLSKYTNHEDINTSIILSDGAGATIISESEQEELYYSYIKSEGQKSDILTCKVNEKIYMDGIEIYKYAVTETVKSINKILKESNEEIENIKYIIPHQSNQRIMNSIAKKLNIDINKIYTNIEYTGNTFCASIPIALNELFEKKLLNKGDKIILLGYGGGLNTGTILLEV